MPPGNPGPAPVAQRTAPLETTLYAVIRVLQEEMASADDATIVATVLHLMQSGHLTWRRRAGLAWSEDLPAT